jgi:hypothetical protein
MANPEPENAGIGNGLDSDLVYCNGIDPATGQYAVAPTTIEDLAKLVLERPGVAAYENLVGDSQLEFAVPYGTSLDQVGQVGWGVVFHEDASQDVRDALATLIEHRRATVGGLLKVLDYKKGEQVRDWYRRHGISAGNLEPELVPYYLLLGRRPRFRSNSSTSSASNTRSGGSSSTPPPITRRTQLPSRTTRPRPS